MLSRCTHSLSRTASLDASCHRCRHVASCDWRRSRALIEAVRAADKSADTCTAGRASAMDSRATCGSSLLHDSLADVAVRLTSATYSSVASIAGRDGRDAQRRLRSCDRNDDAAGQR